MRRHTFLVSVYFLQRNTKTNGSRAIEFRKTMSRDFALVVLALFVWFSIANTNTREQKVGCWLCHEKWVRCLILHPVFWLACLEYLLIVSLFQEHGLSHKVQLCSFCEMCVRVRFRVSFVRLYFITTKYNAYIVHSGERKPFVVLRGLYAGPRKSTCSGRPRNWEESWFCFWSCSSLQLPRHFERPPVQGYPPGFLEKWNK